VWWRRPVQPLVLGASRLHTSAVLRSEGTEEDFAPLPESGVADTRTVSVVGAPLAYGQRLDGVDEGPSIIREQNLRGRITELGWRFNDTGDIAVEKLSSPGIDPTQGGRHAHSVGVTCHRIAEAVRREAMEQNFVLTLGGDHSVAMGSIAGVLSARPSLGVVWVDAHADINTPSTSPSGNVHGMPVAFLMRLVEVAKYQGLEWLVKSELQVPRLEPHRIVYIGLRQVDKGERNLLRRLGIRAYDMHQVDRLGIAKVMEETLEYLIGTKVGPSPLHLSFDIDACDPSIAPSTGTTVEGGLNFRESHYICEELAKTRLLGSMDMVEVNPSLGSSRKDAATTAKTAAGLIASALGLSVL
jgi:arginase